MTLDVALVLAVLAGATVLFITERLRVDVVALLVLVAVMLLGLISPDQALAGLSNNAVVTVGAVFVLSGGLARTGVAAILGQRVLRFAGSSERRLLVAIMSVAAFLSAFMNNVGVAALMLPVVMDIARQTKLPPSRLLIPLTFSSLLGGLNTLIGTAPNILVAEALGRQGLEPFRLFDYTPVGFAVTAAGITFMTLAGPRLLPSRQGGLEPTGRSLDDLDQLYSLHERLLIIRLLEDSALAGRSLADSRIGSALGMSVVGILRDKETLLAPDGATRLEPGDRLLVAGHSRSLAMRSSGQRVLVDEGGLDIERQVLSELEMVEVRPAAGASIVGATLREADFRQRFGLNVLAVRRGGALVRRDLPNWRLEPDDVLVVQGTRATISALRMGAGDELEVSQARHGEAYPLHERLSVARVPAESNLVGVSLAKSRLGDVLGLTVLGIVRGDALLLLPGPDQRLAADDALLLEGGPNDLLTLRGLQGLCADRQATADLHELETERFGLVEVALSPHSSMVGKTLRALQFRERRGLSALAIFRAGRAHYANLRDRQLRLGDALLLYGKRETLRALADDPDFLMLSQADTKPRAKKAPVAVLVMAAVVSAVLFGVAPIHVAALCGALIMVLSGCLSIDEAYLAIQWRAVFLIAGMLGLGTAMQQSGAAALIAGGVTSTLGGFGPIAIVAGMFWLTPLAAQIMPTAAVAVLLAPIAVDTAQQIGMSPYALAMTVAMAASASFMSPVAHPANVMIMGPGGYRFTDYTRIGMPLTLIMFIVVMIVLPIAWPLHG